MGDPLLRIDRISKSFGTRTVLREVSLDVARGEVCCIIGPSGSGKSTLLRCINHLEPVSTGRVLVDGEIIGNEEIRGLLVERRPGDIARQRAQMGMVFQHFELVRHRTALDNVALPIRLVKRRPWAQARARAQQLLESVGLADRSAAYPAQLSGGQRQRVGIARALALDPRLLLLDEPTSALDPELVGEVLDVIRKLTEAGRTMVVVTHEMRFAREVADRVVFMDDGHILEEGSPAQVFGSPQHERTADFLSKVIA